MEDLNLFFTRGGCGAPFLPVPRIGMASRKAVGA